MFLVIASTAHGSNAADTGQGPFPVYPEIRNNVEFWKGIYSKYTTRQWVLHDSEEMDIVYRVVDVPQGVCPYSRSGRRASDRQKDRLRALLLRFSEGDQPKSKEERRILALLGPNPNIPRLRQAADRVRVQLGQADRFREGIIRSGKYHSMIEEKFRQRGLPVELTYLPHVESSFNTRAYSKFGAAGMWQFMRSTGTQYMKVGYVVDERLDPVKSTEAAAKLLGHHYQELSSWPLALTAYNHGLSGMKRAVKQTGTNSYPAIFKRHKSPSFGFASRNFYSEFLAAKHVAKNYKQYFGDLPLARPSPFVEVRLPKPCSILSLAESLAVSKQDFLDLNPAIRPVVFASNCLLPKGIELRLPQRKDANYPNLITSTRQSARRDPSPSRDSLKASPGDELNGQAERHGVKPADLKTANKKVDEAIAVGQVLKLPKGRQPAALPRKKGPEQTRTVTSEAKERIEKTVEPVPIASSTIAQMDSFGPPFPTDQYLKAQGAFSRPGSYSVTEVRGKHGTGTGIVAVEPGETLGHYADWLGVPPRDLRKFNGFSPKRHVRIGEQVKIPLAKGDKAEFERKRMEYHSGIEEDFFSAYKVADLVQHKVVPGENIWTLCRETYEAPFWLVSAYNRGKDLEALRVGDTIVFPVPELVSLQ